MPAARPSAALAPWVAGLVLAAITAFAPQVFNDGDTWLHIAAGQRMLDLHAVLHVDPFSYTFAGRPWQTHEWLSEVVMATAYRSAGWAGVALMFALAAGATGGLLARHAGRWLGGVPLALLLVLSLTTLAPSLLARPHLLALPFLEMWTAELVIARSETRLPSWRRLAPLILIWANLHASFLFGLGLLGAFGLESVLRAPAVRRRTVLLHWTWIAAVCAIACVVSPHGLDNLLFPLRLTGMKTLSSIGEWAPAKLGWNSPFEVALLVGVFVLVWKRVRVPVLHLLLLLLLVHLCLEHARHVLLFAVVAPLLLAQPLGEAAAAMEASDAKPAAWRRAVGPALAVVLAVSRLALPLTPREAPADPVAALAHVPAGLRALPVFNAYPFGGYLIFSGVKPYIDSRAELYGDPFRAAYLTLGDDPQALRAELDRRGVAWTLLQPGSQAARAMDATPGWRRLYADGLAVVHVRAGSSTNR